MKFSLTNLNNVFAPRLAGNTFLMADYSAPTQSAYNSNNHTSSSMGPKKMKNFFKKSPLVPLVIVVVLVVIVGGVAINSVMSKSSSSSSVLSANNKQVSVDKPLASQSLNRSFNFPLKDQTGKEVSQLRYEIQDVQLLDQIIVKGQRATAVKGRTFLIVNLKITNNYDKSVQLNSKDYVRLIVGSNPEKLAADIHNDPVDVQAISTKYTRLGFPINEGEKSLTLQVGEITGKKETIILNLK